MKKQFILLLLDQPTGVSWPTTIFGLRGPSAREGKTAHECASTQPRTAQPSSGSLSAAATGKWDPHASESKQGTERDDGAAAAKLADGEVPGETEGTNVLPMPNRVR